MNIPDITQPNIPKVLLRHVDKHLEGFTVTPLESGNFILHQNFTGCLCLEKIYGTRDGVNRAIVDKVLDRLHDDSVFSKQKEKVLAEIGEFDPYDKRWEEYSAWYYYVNQEVKALLGKDLFWEDIS